MRAPIVAALTALACIGFAGQSAVALEAPQVAGNWRLPGGSCAPAYFQAGEASKTRRNEASVKATVTKDGVVVTGNLVLAGARRGQLISDANDSAVFLIDSRADKLSLFPIAADVMPWGETLLEKCP